MPRVPSPGVIVSRGTSASFCALGAIPAEHALSDKASAVPAAAPATASLGARIRARLFRVPLAG
jgi:hypothetical protein